MSLQLRRTSLSSSILELKSPTLSRIGLHMAAVESIGTVDNCLFYPGDLLRIGSEIEGDLLLVKATHSTMELLYPGILFARRYGEFIILDTPHQPTIDIEQWEIIGAVKGVERPLDQAAFGVENWWLKIHGVEGVLSNEWISYIESMSLPPEYVAELAKELSSIKGASIQASWTREGLENAIVPVPETVIFSLHKLETASGFVSSWAAASKRQLRRKRQRRRHFRSRSVLLPVPECHRFVASIETSLLYNDGQLASK